MTAQYKTLHYITEQNITTHISLSQSRWLETLQNSTAQYKTLQHTTKHNTTNKLPAWPGEGLKTFIIRAHNRTKHDSSSYDTTAQNTSTFLRAMLKYKTENESAEN